MEHVDVLWADGQYIGFQRGDVVGTITMYFDLWTNVKFKHLWGPEQGE